jgi:hypothetical protein
MRFVEVEDEFEIFLSCCKEFGQPEQKLNGSQPIAQTAVSSYRLPFFLAVYTFLVLEIWLCDLALFYIYLIYTI